MSAFNRAICLGLAAALWTGGHFAPRLNAQDEPQLSPQEVAAIMNAGWSWFESANDYQPYLPEKMPEPEKLIRLCILTARKCELRGARIPDSPIATAQARLGDQEGMEQTFREFKTTREWQLTPRMELAFAMRTDLVLPDDFKYEKTAYYIRHLAERYSEQGQLERAKAALSRLPEPDRILALVQTAYPRFAEYLIASGRKDEARRYLDKYLDVLRRDHSPQDQLRSAKEVMSLWRKVAPANEIQQFLLECEDWARDAIPTIESAPGRSAEDVARIADAAGDPAKCQKWLLAARAQIKSSEPDAREAVRVSMWCFRLSRLASIQARLGFPEDAQSTATAAIDRAMGQIAGAERDNTLSSVVGHLASFGGSPGLLQPMDRAIREIQTIRPRAMALLDAAESEIRHEHWSAATSHLDACDVALAQKDIEPAEQFVHQFQLDLLRARMEAKQGQRDQSRSHLRSLLKRGYSPAAGDFIEMIFDAQLELGFFDDAYRTAIWIPKLETRAFRLANLVDRLVETQLADKK